MREWGDWLIRILTLPAPFTIGLLWGASLGRRDSFATSVFVLAPIVSGVLCVGAWLAIAFLMGEQMVNPNIPAWESLTITIAFYGGGCMLGGAIPALLGCAGGQLGKLWLFRRDKGIRQTERADQNEAEGGRR
jgi:hypothetical protein